MLSNSYASFLPGLFLDACVTVRFDLKKPQKGLVPVKGRAVSNVAIVYIHKLLRSKIQ